MSISALNAAWQTDIQPPARKLVLLFLANSQNAVTGQLNPSMAAMARACGISTQQARRHVHELIDARFVEVIGNHFGGAPTATRHYRLNLEALTTTASDTPTADDTPTTGERDPYHPRSVPLSPMTVTPITGDSQNRRKQKEPEQNQKVEGAKRAAPLPDEFQPDTEGMNYANQRGIAVAEELENFRDYHLARGLTRKDWQASWRTWCRNAERFGRAATSRPPAPTIPTRSKKAVPRENFEAVDYGDGIRPL